MVSRIEVLGTGCSKCRRLEKNVRTVVAELGAEIEVILVEDMNEIAERGAMMTPGLIIDGEIVALGRVPGVDEIKEMLSER